MTEKEYLNIAVNTAGIYLFTNNINGKHYVGQSIDIRNRFCDHMTRMKRQFNYPIYNALNKYGLESFSWEIIEVVDKNKFLDLKDLIKTLDSLEIKWIEYYDSYNKGYNLTKGGHSIAGYKFSEETCKKISNSIKKVSRDGRFKIYVYNVISEEYSEWDTLKDFNKNTGNTNRNLTSSDFVLVDHQWIGAKTKDLLQEKIAFWEEYKNNYNNAIFRGEFVQKLDFSNEEILNDIKLLNWKDFCTKYNISKATYYNYRKRLNIPSNTAIGKDPRIKCCPKDFIKDYYVLTREQIIEKYGISQRTYYTWKEKYITNKITFNSKCNN